MTEENTTRPMANLITEAREGRLSVSLTPEEFVNIDRDCERFKDLIGNIQRRCEMIASTEPKDWGMGAENPILTSAKVMVDRFRTKAKGAQDGNDAYSILEQHYQVIEDIQTVHRIILDRYIAADSGFAAAVREYEAGLGDPEPIVGAPRQPGMTARL